MINTRYFFIQLLMLFLSTAPVFAAVAPYLENGDAMAHQHGSHEECPVKTAQDIIRCAQEEHLAVKRARLALLSSDALDQIARQVPNPEFQTLTAFGDSTMQSENSLLQPIDIGNKRRARINDAKAQKKRIEADIQRIQADVTIESVLNLYRLRHLDQEMGILSDTIKVFTQLISQFRSRPFLSPDQEVVLGIYEIALSDAQLKKAGLRDQEREIEHYFHVNTGHGLDELRKVLPPPVTQWPQLKEDLEITSSPDLNYLAAEKEIAKSQVILVKAESRPDLKAGPAIVLNQQGDTRQGLVGAQVSVPIPIFHRNTARQAYAASELDRSEKAIALLKTEETHERAEQLKAYRSAVQALDGAMTESDIEGRYRRLNGFVQRGLISGALMVEAYRQRYDAQANRNEREYLAIKSLWTLYKYDGQIFKETL